MYDCRSLFNKMNLLFKQQLQLQITTNTDNNTTTTQIKQQQPLFNNSSSNNNTNLNNKYYNQITIINNNFNLNSILNNPFLNSEIIESLILNFTIRFLKNNITEEEIEQILINNQDNFIQASNNNSNNTEQEQELEFEIEKLETIKRIKNIIKMTAKSMSNYSSPNTLIPSVSKTFISPFGLSSNSNINNNNINNNNNGNLIESSNNVNNQLCNSSYNNSNNNNSNFMDDQFDIFLIPTEMLVHLLSFLSANDLWRISQTCKRIWYIVDVFKFWEILFEKTCPRIYYAMQFNSRWSNPTSFQSKMILCFIDKLPTEYYKNFDKSDESGQIKKIIGVMNENLHNPMILRETCYILKRLSYRQRKEDEHESLIARYGGISLILQAMKNHPYDAGVQEDACGALGNLTCDSPNNMGLYSNDNYLSVVEQGGIQLILAAMKHHMMNPGVQYNTSFVLRNLARNDVSESRVAIEGGIQSIATAMKNHPNHIGIQTQGCGALRNLGCNDSNKILSAKEGGIGLILRAMRSFSSHPDLQLNGCGALRNLARNEDNKNMISRQSGIQLVLQAMSNHPDDPDVQDEGCAALINLAYQDEANEETIAREGGIALILKAMRNHPYHSGVQMQGRGALKNLSCNPKNKLTIARSGGIELMNIAMQNHPNFANRFLELMRILQVALEDQAQ